MQSVGFDFQVKEITVLFLKFSYYLWAVLSKKLEGSFIFLDVVGVVASGIVESI